MGARSLTVNFKAQGEKKVQQAGKKAEKALDDVGKAAEDAGEGAGGATDSIRSLSETLGGELGPAAGEVLGTFDKISGVIGQVGNAAKVLSGVAIVELILQFKSFYDTMMVNERALENQKAAVEALAGALDQLAASQESVAAGADLDPLLAPEQFREQAYAAQRRVQGIEAEVNTLLAAERKLLEERVKFQEALSPNTYGQDPAIERQLSAVQQQIEEAQTRLFNARGDVRILQDEIKAERIREEKEFKKLFPEKKKGPPEDRITAHRELLSLITDRLVVAQYAMRDAAIETFDRIEAGQVTDATWKAVRAGQQLVIDGYHAIGAAVDQAGAAQRWLHEQNLAMIAAEVEANNAKVQGVLGNAAFLFEQVGGLERATAAIKGASALADAAEETARIPVALARYDFWAAAKHALGAAGLVVAAQKQFAVAGGGGGGGGGGGAVALSAPSPPTDSDIAGGGGRGDGRREGVTYVTFNGPVYDTDEAARRAMASQTIRGINDLSRTAGTPRVRAAAIRER